MIAFLVLGDAKKLKLQFSEAPECIFSLCTLATTSKITSLAHITTMVNAVTPEKSPALITMLRY